jgi:hypothetical protein
MRILTAGVFFVCLPALAAGLAQEQVHGAWLQDGVKWTKAPPDINPQLQTGEAEILYFDKDQTFAVVHCVVNRVPKQYQTISHGDGEVVYRGRWTGVGDTIAVDYRLVSRTVAIKGEELPGPIQHATIRESGGTLSFDRKAFRRTPTLDKSVTEILSGALPTPPH